MSRRHYSEVISLLQRNKSGSNDLKNMEDDLGRLLLMSGDSYQRKAIIEAQGISRVLKICKLANSVLLKKYCTGIVINLARAEKGRLSASSCQFWDCHSHCHNCVIFYLLEQSQCSSDASLRCISMAAVLALSVQSECQMQIDNVAGIPILLRLLDAKESVLNVYTAGVLWNMCKSPVIILKLESIHGILLDTVTEKLTAHLRVAVQPFQLHFSNDILGPGDENTNILLTASISSSLAIVLQVENYIGPPRTMHEQFTLGNKPKRRVRQSQSLIDASLMKFQSEQISVPVYDECGIIQSRSCGVCGKSVILTAPNDEDNNFKYLCCANASCTQTFHFLCSRWKKIPIIDIRKDHFFCLKCQDALSKRICYLDFKAEHPEMSEILGEKQFSTLNISRAPKESVNHEDTTSTQNLNMIFSK